jgi:hypothetical protein
MSATSWPMVTIPDEAAAETHMAQLHHNMWVTASRTAVLSIITGGGRWVEMTIPADPLYQHLLLTSERKFWRCVQSGELPRPFGIEPHDRDLVPHIAASRRLDAAVSQLLRDAAIWLGCSARDLIPGHFR